MRLARPALAAALAAACATARPPAYSERCTDGAAPCALSYDFEPSGAAADVFGDKGSFLLLNEDGAFFRWRLGDKSEWDQDHVAFAGTFAPLLHKLESATSAVCNGTPVFLAATNFMPGRKGRDPKRERVAALVGSLNAKPRVLEKVSAAIVSLAAPDAPAKVEGLALSPDCRTLHVGLRSRHPAAGEVTSREVVPLAIDVDWAGEREEVSVGPAVKLEGAGCSGHDEGLSDLAALPDGGLVVATSYEKTFQAREKPEDVPRGELAGSLWRRAPDGAVTRLACFPGHKPEAVAVMPDAKSVRVVFEDDDYDGRPIRAYAVAVPLP